MEDIPDKSKVPIKVQFEYLKDNNTIDLSKEYTINISLLDDTKFEDNKEKIIKNANFKTPKERSYYHMFNKSKKKFLTQNSDFISYIKTNSPIVLINCYTYAGEILKKVKEESENLELPMEQEAKFAEIKKKELSLLLSCLDNNLQVDMFADEFIFKNGIEYLVIIVKNSKEDIKMHALEGIIRLLSFENAFAFFEKKKDILKIFYTSFINNTEICSAYLFFDIIIKLIGGNSSVISDIVELMNNPFLIMIMNYLSEDNKDDKIKKHTLLFINMILNFSSPEKSSEILYQLTEVGIFEKIDKIVKFKEDIFIEDLNLFEQSVEKILNEYDKKSDNYKIIKEKFDTFIKNKQIYHIHNLIKATKDEDENIKKNALNELDSLLNAKKNFDIFYDSFMNNENLEIPFLDYIISFIETNKEKTINFINSAKKYAEEKNTKTFLKIINNLSKENKEDIICHTLSFINKILNFSLNNKNNENDSILFYFTEGEIFEKLMDFLLCKDKAILEQLTIFETTIEQIVEKLNKEEENYEKIKSKYVMYMEKKEYYYIKDCILKIHNSKDASRKENVEELIKSVEKKNSYHIVYEVFVDNNNDNLAFTYFDVFILIFGASDEKISQLIDIAKKYAEKHNSIIFDKLIYYTSEDNHNIMAKGMAMQMINIIMDYSKNEDRYKLLVQYTKSGIFDNLKKLISNKDGVIKAQLKLVLKEIDITLKNADKNDENYNKINELYKKVDGDRNTYEHIIDNFVIMDDDF